MVIERGGCVYITTNKLHTVFYTGVTSDLRGRIWEHKNKTYPNSFTARYNCDKLVYYYFYSTIDEAIPVEKLIKGGSRDSKKQLVQQMNPDWIDLYDEVIKE